MEKLKDQTTQQEILQQLMNWQLDIDDFTQNSSFESQLAQEQKWSN